MANKRVFLTREERESLKSRLDADDLSQEDRELLKTILDNLLEKKSHEEGKVEKKKRREDNTGSKKKGDCYFLLMSLN